jgi:Tol biopolymer transport system component
VRKRLILGSILFSLTTGALAYAVWVHSFGAWEPIQHFEQIDRQAHTEPDYSDTVIPPNIAPLNFSVAEPGVAFCAKISSQKGEPIEVFSGDGTIEIPQRRWRDLLGNNKGQDLHVEVFVRNQEGSWHRFQSTRSLIAPEDIDGYLVYRKMPATHLRVRGEMGIYCRNLSTFEESVVLRSTSYENGCLNCHAFPQNSGNKMLLGVRSTKYGVGTLLVDDGMVREIGTKFGYTSWHPSGRMAVYAVNNLPMFYHAARSEVRDTVNIDSLLASYLCDQQRVDVEPKLARKDRLENWPAWSADGTYLYFCSAPKLWPSDTPNPPNKYNQVKYDLLRISYDIETHTWGEIETVLSAQQTGKSVSMPRCSPDGRWLTFCLVDYGYFASWKDESDLYAIDLRAARQTGQFTHRPLEINSDKSESWHTWSNNSRWIVFSSKRLHGIFTRPFISYVDAAGKTYKPFVLPQNDPRFYGACLRTFNTPELVTAPPSANGRGLGESLSRPRRNTGLHAHHDGHTQCEPKHSGLCGLAGAARISHDMATADMRHQAGRRCNRSRQWGVLS